MKTRIKTFITIFMAVPILLGLFMFKPVYAECVCETKNGKEVCTDSETKKACEKGGNSVQDGIDVTKGSFSQTDLSKFIKNIVNTFLYVIGVVAVIMMIFGGFQYITSSGDAAKVTKAKNTILYGVVGLVIALLAYAIVNFVITSL